MFVLVIEVEGVLIFKWKENLFIRCRVKYWYEKLLVYLDLGILGGDKYVLVIYKKMLL